MEVHNERRMNPQTSYSDGHGPATCNYNACHAKVDTPCPFVRDTLPTGEERTSMTEQVSGPSKPECKHRWRQYWVYDIADQRTVPDGYFCTKCLAQRR
jgi:hypothetical protein